MVFSASTPKMDGLDRRLLDELQERFPLARYPFRALADRVGEDEAAVIGRLARLRESGVLRQISAIFDTKALGYRSSLVAMNVPAHRLDEAAKIINAHPGVSHNYRRSHEFNLWLTIAVPPTSDLQAHVDALHRMAGAESTRTLPTLRLFKIGVTLDMSGDRPLDHRSAPAYTHEQRERASRSALTPRDIDVIRVVQSDLDLVPDPFATPAGALGTDSDGLIEELNSLQERGYLRRFAAILRHRQAGFGANAMAVWNVPDRDVLEVGQAMAGYTAISHCYLRPRYDDWKYNLFTMIHGRKKADCEAFVQQLARTHGLDDFTTLYSTTEYKKVRLAYFTPEFDAWERRHVSQEFA